MKVLDNLKAKWSLDLHISNGASIENIYEFQCRYDISLPLDMLNYLKVVNGTQDKYLDDLFIFYSIKKIKPLIDEFRDWRGIPDYYKLIQEFKFVKDFFVIGNYQSNLFSYAIRLKNGYGEKGEVYVFCGENYRRIATSFSEFMELYLNDSIDLYF